MEPDRLHAGTDRFRRPANGPSPSPSSTIGCVANRTSSLKPKDAPLQFIQQVQDFAAGTRILEPMKGFETAKIILVMFLWAICFPLITAGFAFAPHLTFATLRAFLAGAVLVAVGFALG
ncbi:MAG: hypothetical protein V3R90_05320, partial [Limibaculum sp.]